MSPTSSRGPPSKLVSRQNPLSWFSRDHSLYWEGLGMLRST
ncbi:putative proline-rich protein 36 [Iris pallida]|uniref:Proline-rich protein 36 n=1 Tax=Iris pallida TaxID=29817 RepID=A0AAX6HLD8_IRIPA|nr:putative proline-rich protein 36 [Iris pallida]